MVADVKIKIRNKDRLIKKLEGLVPGLEEQLDKDLNKSANELLSTVKSFVPEHTGQYKDSLNVKPVRQMDVETKKGTTRFMGVRAFGLYAHFKWKWLEFGTVAMQARPHIYGSFRLLKRRIKSRIARGINKQVKAEIARRGGGK